MPSTYIDLSVHIVFRTKNRTPFLTGELAERTHAYLGGVLTNLDVVPISICGVEDHVHMLAGLTANHRLADVVRETKKACLWWLRQDVGIKGFSWQEGYAGFSVSHERQAAIKKYIARQAEHHKTKSFNEELIELLELAQVQYDPKYLL